MQLRLEEEKKAAEKEAARAKMLLDDQLKLQRDEKVRVMCFIFDLYCKSYHIWIVFGSISMTDQSIVLVDSMFYVIVHI